MDTAEKIILFFFLLQDVCSSNFSIRLTEKIEALSGSCVIINCTFEIEDKYDTNLTESDATGQWFINGTDVNINLVFNSSDPKPDHFQGAINGKLHEKSCTTIFYDVNSNHNGKYYFRIESGALKYTYKENTSTINVIESPPKPTVKLYVVQDQEEVLEGSSVSLRCSAETLCSSPPPTLTWSSTPRIPLSESSRRQELISDLNFTAAHSHHRVTFTCTITYQILDKNKTAQNNITLHVQYAPKISPSSSCNRINVGLIVCFCEFDGNPSPKLEWHLSGRPVTNSSDTFISEERLSSTVLRSSITLHQSLTHTSLQCVGNNTRGTERKLFQVPPPVSWLNLPTVMIGVAVTALVFLMSYAITCICILKVNGKLLQTTQEGAGRNGHNTDEALPHENQGDSVYVTMTSAEATTENPESLIYSSTDFKRCKPKSQEIGSISSLHANYAAIKHCSGGVSKAESSMGESSRAIEAPVIVSVDGVTKQTESKDSEEELFADSSQLYGKVKRRKP
ncbi:sialic acid-binding Ig-like lectin 7 [Chanodichthys erythropterus]|uniref:sialic acid-binding Ig-like lectin 7 n=1 Tax=Chanodichthys erythropterus TaxID=933992 RepID=UPI00351E3B98